MHVDTKEAAVNLVTHMPYAGHVLTTEALNAYALAHVQMDQATGVVLETNHVEMDQAKSGRRVSGQQNRSEGANQRA